VKARGRNWGLRRRVLAQCVRATRSATERPAAGPCGHQLLPRLGDHTLNVGPRPDADLHRVGTQHHTEVNDQLPRRLWMPRTVSQLLTSAVRSARWAGLTDPGPPCERQGAGGLRCSPSSLGIDQGIVETRVGHSVAVVALPSESCAAITAVRASVSRPAKYRVSRAWTGPTTSSSGTPPQRG
jgi:hypothetical protein